MQVCHAENQMPGFPPSQIDSSSATMLRGTRHVVRHTAAAIPSSTKQPRGSAHHNSDSTQSPRSGSATQDGPDRLLPGENTPQHTDHFATVHTGNNRSSFTQPHKTSAANRTSKGESEAESLPATDCLIRKRLITRDLQTPNAMRMHDTQSMLAPVCDAHTALLCHAIETTRSMGPVGPHKGAPRGACNVAPMPYGTVLHIARCNTSTSWSGKRDMAAVAVDQALCWWEPIC